MVFNTMDEKRMGEKLMTKLRKVDDGFFLGASYFDSSVQNFLMYNQYAIESRDITKFDPVCIMNGIHITTKPITTLFDSGHDPTYLWKLLTYLLFVYNPFYELSKKEVAKINDFLSCHP